MKKIDYLKSTVSKVNFSGPELAFFVMKEFKLIKTLEKFEKLEPLSKNSFQVTVSYAEYLRDPSHNDNVDSHIAFLNEISKNDFYLDYIFMNPIGELFRVKCLASLEESGTNFKGDAFVFSIKPIVVYKIDDISKCLSS